MPLDCSPQFHMIELDETTSTNSFLADYRPARGSELTLVTAEYQSAGRGQKGNTWESARSMNLLFSLAIQPESLPAGCVFLLSEMMALSIRDALATFLGKELTAAPAVGVKWPNDIYVGDSKIAGILIENDLRGGLVGRCIIGCGVNINQEFFESDAPNPISLRQLLGHEVERSFVLDAIIMNFRRYYSALHADLASRGRDSEVPPLHEAYRRALYRGTGFYPYIDTSSSEQFSAEIADVEPTGHLLLRDSQGNLRRYAFKEVSFVLG